MINRIAIVSNQAASRIFYLDMLRFVVLDENPMDPNKTWMQLTLSDNVDGIFQTLIAA